jgi:hypothetical protein
MSARDYKNAGRRQPLFDLAPYRQFGAGLAVGLVLALFVWIHDHSDGSQPVDDLTEAAGPDAIADESPPAGGPDGSDDESADHVFYNMLPSFEVEVPDRSSATQRNQPIEPVARPGAYVLQVGAYRNVSGAELMRDKLAKLQIEASILHVSDDTDEWHVVRIGPIRDLDRVNTMQKTLRAAGVDVLVQRAGD